MRYAIIEDGKVANIAVADAPLNDSWVPAGNAKKGDSWDGSSFTSPDATPEEIAAVAERAADAAKMTGVEILGKMCSATGKDQAGLSAVAVGAMRAQMAGQSFAPTKFTFENGTELVITPENFAAIEAIWTPFRQSFYAVGE